MGRMSQLPGTKAWCLGATGAVGLGVVVKKNHEIMIHARTRSHVNICHVYIYICMYVNKHIYIYMCIYIYMYMYMYECKYPGHVP